MKLWPTHKASVGIRESMPPQFKTPCLSSKQGVYEERSPSRTPTRCAAKAAICLPDEVWLAVLAHTGCDGTFRVRLESVSRQFLRVARDDSYWRTYATPPYDGRLASEGALPTLGSAARHSFQRWVAQLDSVSRADVAEVLARKPSEVPLTVERYGGRFAPVWVSVCKNPRAFLRANETLKESRALTELAIEREGLNYAGVCPVYREDDAIAMRAVHANGWVLPYLPTRLQDASHVRAAAYASIATQSPTKNMQHYYKAMPKMQQDPCVREAMLKSSPDLCQCF